MAILQLEEERLALGDPVIKYLPDLSLPKEARRSVTIHHFLTHTSGLPPTGALRYSMVKSIEGDPYALELKRKGRWKEWLDHLAIKTYEDLMSYIGNHVTELLGPSGGQFFYSTPMMLMLFKGLL